MVLVQVKAHDIRAFAAFYGGALVDQIMQACHWKAHITFTICYLKDLGQIKTTVCTWVPVVAAQQVKKTLSLRHVILGKKERGGRAGTFPATKSSGV